MNGFVLKDVGSLWQIICNGVELTLSKEDGCLRKSAVVAGEKECLWAEYAGDVTVRDDKIRYRFGRADLECVEFFPEQDSLTLRKRFRNGVFTLEERYYADAGDLAWESTLVLDKDEEFRSCSVRWEMPLPQPVFRVKIWAAREGMPAEVSRYAHVALEYGEATSGTLLPVFACYDSNSTLAFTLPFDYKTPRFRYVLGFREKDLGVEFDFLALSPDSPARTKFLMKGMDCGDYRPALGWVYERYNEYFEPACPRIHSLWGGHICGNFTEKEESIRDMVRLGIKWYEIHGHFPAYGNYHPEGMEQWVSGHYREDKTPISVETVRNTIKTLHKNGVAAFPYLQVSGDGDEKLLSPEMVSCRIRNRRGKEWTAWPGTKMMNSDPALPFGKDIARQIDGIVERYPEMDGIFLDQPCYNFIDTAHHDSMTAIDNEKAYMSGFNYYPHLEHLSARLHPEKAIIGNGPFCVGLMKYLDGVMAEGDSHLCERLQYYSLGRKPLFFLMYEYDDAHIELMFQKALLYGAGFASYPSAMPSKDLFDLYMPLLERMYRRRWVFDPDPLTVPVGFLGNIYRSERGTLLVSLVRNMSRLQGRSAEEGVLKVSASGWEKVKRCTLTCPGEPEKDLPFTVEEKALSVKLPSSLAAGLLEFY